MKFIAAAIAALAGSTIAAPIVVGTQQNEREWHQYYVNRGTESQQLSKRIGPVGLAVATVVGGAALGFFTGPVANRVLNDIFGVQKKRSVHLNVADLTFDEARALYLDRYTDVLFEEYPHDGNDAAVCTGVGYAISDPSATLEAAEYKFTADGQEAQFDCFIVSGPVTFTVPANVSSADFSFAAPEDSTFVDGVLTIF